MQEKGVPNMDNHKTFKEKMKILKGNISDPEIALEDLELYPEDFYQLTEKQLFYLWHYLSDKEIAKLYGVSEYAVNKQRRIFGINPISSMYDRLSRDLPTSKNK